MDKTSNNNTKLVEITKEAISQFKKILLQENKDSFVRIYVDSGGCSGFSYSFSLDDQSNDNDLVIKAHGINLVVDKISADLLDG